MEMTPHDGSQPPITILPNGGHISKPGLKLTVVSDWRGKNIGIKVEGASTVTTPDPIEQSSERCEIE